MSNRQLVYKLFELPFVRLQEFCQEMGFDPGERNKHHTLLTDFLNFITEANRLAELKIKVAAIEEI